MRATGARALAVTVALVLGAGIAAGATTAAVTPHTLGPLRPWGGTEIRSLDPGGSRPGVAPARASAARTRQTARAAQSTTGSPRRDEVLSTQGTARWAYVAAIAPIRERARSTSRRVTSLHWYTEDGFPEVYLLLRTHWDARGREWVKLRIPMRPNGRVGWVRRQDLGSFHLTHLALTVDRERLRMYLFSHGHLIWSAPVGVGRPSTPTPAGHFWIRERFKIADPSSGYWPYAFGTSDYSTLTDWPGGGVVGIHGPYYDNSGIPGRISHGCMRLHPADDAWLAHHIGLGTPVLVR